jgi:hypothetical protein
MTGTGSLGITVAVLLQVESVHALSTGILILLSGSSAGMIGIAGIGLVLDYKRATLEIGVSMDTVRLQMDVERIRLGMYRELIERSAETANSAAHYQGLILADALHLAAERVGTSPGRRRPVHVTGTGKDKSNLT